MSSLETKLAAALSARDDRLIRRRLADPAADEGLADFFTNDYLSLSTDPALRAHFLAKLVAAPNILGSGGSRLLVNGHAHAALETRLAALFDAPCALLFNSGFDANVGFFACVPQPHDAVVFDAHIHASVHDGMRASRVAAASCVSFPHNSASGLRFVLVRLLAEREGLRTGADSAFIAVETLYSMDGSIAPLAEIVTLMDELFPLGNAHIVVDEAHATGVFGPRGRGLVAALGLEHRILARLHTFGKALAGTGAVLLTTPLVRDYLLNYARSLIYTTSLAHANIVAVGCSLDLLEDGTTEKLAANLHELTTHFLLRLQPRIATLPPSILSLPSALATELPSVPIPIIPLLTPRPHALSAFLRTRGLNARPIAWPTVQRGAERVRVCLHAGNTRAEVEQLVDAAVEWAQEQAAGDGRTKL